MGTLWHASSPAGLLPVPAHRGMCLQQQASPCTDLRHTPFMFTSFKLGTSLTSIHCLCSKVSRGWTHSMMRRHTALRVYLRRRIVRRWSRKLGSRCVLCQLRDLLAVLANSARTYQTHSMALVLLALSAELGSRLALHMYRLFLLSSWKGWSG